MSEQPKKTPESRITHDCDGSVSCATPQQNKNKSAGSARKSAAPPAHVVRRGKDAS